MRRKVTFYFYDRKVTKFMQTSGAFEPWKVLRVKQVYSGELEGDEPLETMCRKLVATAVQGEYGLIGAATGDGEIWWDEEIKAVSTGTKWAPVEQYLRMMGS